MKGSGPLKLGGIAALYLLWLVSQCSVRYAHAIHRAKQRFVRCVGTRIAHDYQRQLHRRSARGALLGSALSGATESRKRSLYLPTLRVQECSDAPGRSGLVALPGADLGFPRQTRPQKALTRHPAASDLSWQGTVADSAQLQPLDRCARSTPALPPGVYLPAD